MLYGKLEKSVLIPFFPNFVSHFYRISFVDANLPPCSFSLPFFFSLPYQMSKTVSCSFGSLSLFFFIGMVRNYPLFPFYIILLPSTKIEYQHLIDLSARIHRASYMSLFDMDLIHVRFETSRMKNIRNYPG